jgi:hypothetical protein
MLKFIILSTLIGYVGFCAYTTISEGTNTITLGNLVITFFFIGLLRMEQILDRVNALMEIADEQEIEALEEYHLPENWGEEWDDDIEELYDLQNGTTFYPGDLYGEDEGDNEAKLAEWEKEERKAIFERGEELRELPDMTRVFNLPEE